MSDVAILVVEDNPDHRELIVAALAEQCDRNRIATAVDGLDALDFLLARGIYAERDVRKQPRLVILDLRMSRMNGIEMLQALRADPRIASLPVVMLSSTTERDEIDRCYEAGANSVVRKSIDFEELRQKMAKVHDFWVTVNEANRASRV